MLVIARIKPEFVVLAGSLAAMSYALYSQYFQGFHPCELCMWQRYAFCAAIAFAFASIIFKPRVFLKLAIAALLVNSLIAGYHFGIENKWWEGFQTCSSSSAGGSLEELRAEIMSAPITRCDEATWLFLGVSMAGWNVVYSLFLASLSLFLHRKSRIN